MGSHPIHVAVMATGQGTSAEAACPRGPSRPAVARLAFARGQAGAAMRFEFLLVRLHSDRRRHLRSPWHCRHPWPRRRLVVGTGTGALPVMGQVEQEARRREVELVVLPTSRAIALLNQRPPDTNAILHVTC